MAIVNGSLQEGYKDAAWFAANPTLVLLVGQKVNLEQTGTYKLGDGTSQLSALSFLGGNGSGLSGLTTNKVLKAGSATTAVDSNITDDGTTVIISTNLQVDGVIQSPNGLNTVTVVDTVVSLDFNGTTNSGYVSINDTRNEVKHDALVELNAPSVTKNGVEVATVNDIPTVLPRKYFAYNNTTYSYTGTTANTILRTIYIPANSMNLNSTLELHAIFGKSGTAGTMNYAAYITTNPSVITGGSIVKINAFAAGNLQGGFVLRLTNKNSLNSQAVQLQNPGANQYDTWQTANFARTLLSIDFAVDQYIHIYSTLGNATDTAIIYDYQCYIDKN